jgi:hypothetical protein
VARKPKKEGKKAKEARSARLASPHLADIHKLARSFGLVDSTPERWGNLDKAVKQLNAEAPAGVAYKVFFLGKWGTGYLEWGFVVLWSRARIISRTRVGWSRVKLTWVG